MCRITDPEIVDREVGDPEIRNPEVGDPDVGDATRLYCLASHVTMPHVANMSAKTFSAGCQASAVTRLVFSAIVSPPGDPFSLRRSKTQVFPAGSVTVQKRRRHFSSLSAHPAPS